MSYEKKNNYPSVKTPGIYPDEDDRKLGLDTDDLNELSLGNWNSIFKGNKLFLSGNLLEKIKKLGGIEVKFRTSPPKQGTKVLVWRYKRNDEQTSSENAILLAQGPIIEYLTEYENITDQSNRDTQGVKKSRIHRTRAVYEQFYGSVEPNVTVDDIQEIKDEGSGAIDFGDDEQAFVNNENLLSSLGDRFSIYKNLDTTRGRQFCQEVDELLLHRSGDSGKLSSYRDGNDFTIRPLNNHGEEQFTNKAISFNEGRAFIEEREGNGDIVLTLNEVARTKLEEYHVFERTITLDERVNWGDGGSEKGNDKDFTHELIALVDFDIQAINIDDDTLEELKSVTWEGRGGIPNNGEVKDILTQAYLNNYIMENASYITLRGLENILFDGPNNASTNHPFIALNPNFNGGQFAEGKDFFLNDPHNGGYGYYRTEDDTFEANIGAVDWNPGYRTDIKLGADFWPQEIRFDIGETRSMGETNLLPQKPITVPKFPIRINLGLSGDSDKVNAWDDTFSFMGYPNFKFDIAIDNEEYVKQLDTYDTPVDFQVSVKTENDNELLYYDREENPIEYEDTSYPVKVNLNVNLFYDFGFENERDTLDEQEVISAFAAGDAVVQNYLTNTIRIPYYASNPEECYYKYQVIQWGDEKRLLTDEQIESSYFFNFYDSEDYPKTTDYFYRKYQQSQEVEAVPLLIEGARSGGNYAGQLKNTIHAYNTPGIKTIKIIVYRYTPDAAFILQTYLITKNIVVGDGVLKSQDFSIFGGGDFNYIPITDNQVIIGGIDDDSKYNNSVEKLVKEDLFLKQDYLDRTSAKDHIDKFNNGLLGESPSQLNLGQTRMFNKPKDIYDFIGGNRLEWINQGSGSLPLNSLATDIFINNDDCIVDLNPSNSDYSVLNNQVGLSGIGILIGDYELSQPEGGSVTKQGVMEIPELDNTKDRQAF